jgi:hypothetical protein
MQLLSPSTFTVLATVVIAPLAAGPAAAADARAPRLVSAYDPALHVKPPTMVDQDGNGGVLLVPEGFAERAAAFHRQNPGYWPAQAGMGQVGEVAIVEGSEEVLATDGATVGVRMAAVARKVIERYGDNFSALTLWLTFDETVSPRAGAYEFTVKADVRGLGITPQDNGRTFGSMGTLRSILNMKRVWQGVREDTLEAWRPQLEVWGQESGHRWMVFMGVRDPRTGETSDVLLGRDCSHYSRYVDTQGSVHDGLAWIDNQDGTFSTGPDRTFRFGNLDLYGMGLLPPDEMPSFFYIDDIPGYKRGTCGQYDTTAKPLQNRISGTRVEVNIDDIVAANGPRLPSFDELLAGGRQDYFREAQVVITRAGEGAQTPLATQVAQRIDRARVLWEQWMREATRNRMVVCTQLEKDCGDPRSDVTGLRFNPTGRSPSWGPLKVEVDVGNPGQRGATGVTLALETTVEGKSTSASQTVGALAVGASRSTSFDVDLRGHGCGAEIAVKATSQSDFHYHRNIQRLVLGAETAAQDGFETDSGWRVDPDGTDNSAGAVWERGTPERTEIVAGNAIQLAGAHEGTNAWVTGAAARAVGTRDPFVRAGRTTLESPVFEASAWRQPRVRFWTAFAGMKAAATGLGVVPSRDSRLVVQARAMGGQDWMEIDRLENRITVGWVLRSVPLPPALSGRPLQLRFIAEDANPGTGGVEAAIDDVHITSNLPACDQAPPPEPDQGCSCALGRRGPDASFPAGLALLLAHLLRRCVAARRRRRCPPAQ